MRTELTLLTFSREYMTPSTVKVMVVFRGMVAFSF